MRCGVIDESGPGSDRRPAPAFAADEQPLMDLYTSIRWRTGTVFRRTATAGEQAGVWALVKLLVTQVAYFLASPAACC